MARLFLRLDLKTGQKTMKTYLVFGWKRTELYYICSPIKEGRLADDEPFPLVHVVDFGVF